MKKFNLRVYGLIVNERQEILLMDESRNGISFTKFPGGGLEFGEGTKDCLVRELKEELLSDFEIGELFYVNDFFQPSVFHKEHQLISFYYWVNPLPDFQVNNFKKTNDGDYEIPRWVKLTDLDESMLTFPVDKVVAGKMKKKSPSHSD